MMVYQRNYVYEVMRCLRMGESNAMMNPIIHGFKIGKKIDKITKLMRPTTSNSM